MFGKIKALDGALDKYTSGDKIIYGHFNGQSMVGSDFKVYPVPGNYASKSRLVEGDKLKLIITEDGRFIFKQVLPVKRRQFIGKIRESKGNEEIYVEYESKMYMILENSIKFFKLKEGDEVMAMIPFGKESNWAAIENIIRKVI